MLKNFEFTDEELNELDKDKKSVLSKLNGHVLIRKNHNGTVTGVVINRPDEIIKRIVEHHFGTEFILK